MAEPDFSEFDDWLEEETGRWPYRWKNKRRSSKQKAIVERNAALLLQRAPWQEKVDRFEAALASIDDEAERQKQRSRFRIHFDRYKFGKAPKGHDFSGYRFPCSTRFDRATFGAGGVSFDNATFGDGDMSFHNASFGDGDVSFHNASFGDGDVSFHNASFGDGSVWFDNASFENGDVLFGKASFGSGDVSFDFASFGHGDVSFDYASFGNGDLLFGFASFGNGDVSFDYASFGNGDVWFDNNSFGNGNVSFDYASFGDGNVSFGYASFGNGNVSFGKASFENGNVSFGYASFGDGNVSFDNASFGNGNVSFDYASFGNGDMRFTPKSFGAALLSFQDSETAGSLFVTGHFPDGANFARLSVGGTASFSDCVFAEIPDFRDAKFDRPPEVARMDVPKPKMRRRRFISGIWVRQLVRRWPNRRLKHSSWINRFGLFSVATDPDDVAKFRKLKAMAIAANDHERDSYFFAREMMAKRGVETTGFWPLLLDSAYALLSDYGRSIAPPLYGFIASFVLFAAFYSGMLVDRVGMGLRLIFSLEYSWHNALPFLNTLFRFALRPEDYASGFELRLKQVQETIGLDFDWFVLASVVQQLFGGVLLFLLLLGLRNKFRLK